MHFTRTSSPKPSWPHPHRRFRTLALPLLVAATIVSGCSSDGGEGTEATVPDQDGGATTTVASQFGSSMGVAEVTADEVAQLGDGPPAGESWTVPFAISICGRFIEPLTGTVGPITSNPDGTVTVTGSEDGAPTLGQLADAVGMTLAPGSITMPEDATPAELDSTDPPTAVAGATLTDGGTCGPTVGAVEVWVYSADATESGDGIMVVTDDPGAVPFAEEGMSIVLAFAPESSLPTLPPSALGG